MAFDVLQKWHEGSHISTAGYNIQPARMTPVPRTGAWTYINEALSKILPQLDPVEIGRRRMALEQMREYNAQAPYRKAYQEYQMSQIPVLQATGAAAKAKAEAIVKDPSLAFPRNREKEETLSERQLRINREQSEKYEAIKRRSIKESQSPPAVPNVGYAVPGEPTTGFTS